MWVPIAGAPEDSILDSTARFNIWGGPVRSGKTVHSMIRWLTFCMTAPKGDLWMIGKTSGSLERNILAPLKDFTDSAFDYSLTQNKAWLGDREIYTMGASNKDAEARIRGSTAAGIYGDELTLWPANVFKQCGMRMSVRGAAMFGTTNPDGPFHYLKTDYIDKRRSLSNPSGLDLNYFTWRIEENTTLDPAYVRALYQEYTGLWFKRFILGQWVAAEGAIYDFFDEELHVVEQTPEADYFIGAVDYGTSNPTVAGRFGVSRSAGGLVDSQGKRLSPRCWLEETYYYSGRETGRQKTDGEYADDLLAFYGSPTAIQHIIVDPSAASFKAELRKRGFTVKDADNDVINGIRRQAQMLHSGEYRIKADPSNKPVIQEYGAYLWDEKASARGVDKPIKEHDHGKDMERYFLLTEFPTAPLPTTQTRRTAGSYNGMGAGRSQRR